MDSNKFIPVQDYQGWFEIKKVLEKEKPRLLYQLELEWTHGDADATTYTTYMFTHGEKLQLERVLWACDWYLQYRDKFWNDAIEKDPTDNPYTNFEGDKVGETGTLDDRGRLILGTYYFDDIPGDVITDGCLRARLANYKLTYFDGNGKEHEVSYHYPKDFKHSIVYQP